MSKIILVMSSMLLGASVMAQDYVPGQILVKFKSSPDSGGQQFSSKAVALSIDHVKSWDVLNVHQFQLKPGQMESMEDMIQILKSDPNVEYAEPDYILVKQSHGVEGPVLSYDDVMQSRSDAFQKAGAFSTTYNQSSADVDIEPMWTQLSSSPSFMPVVAVIDTGVDYTHEVFTGANAIWVNTDEIPSNGIDDDGNGFIDDVRGWNFVSNNNDPMDDENHGTHVAGITFGATQDIFASSLDSARLLIMPLKFLDNNGSGATSDAIEAIYYAINNGATVINASWGGGSYSDALLDAIIAAYNANVTFIAAAGNAANNNDSSPTYPSNYVVPNVISIAATSDADYVASFSNFGASSVFISSPGVSILSTLPSDSYGYASGTSMAAPLAAGFAALMQSENGGVINGYQTGEIFKLQNDVGVGNVSGKVFTNARVNAQKSVDYVQNNTMSDYQPDYSGYAARSVASAASGGSGGCGLVKSISKNHSSEQPSYFGRILLMLLVLSPFAFAMASRKDRSQAVNRRQHDRYNITSGVTMNVGGKTISGQVSCISTGGVKIDTEALLQNGGVIEMTISSPDGKDKVEAVGRVVWSEEKKSYGVQFCEVDEQRTSLVEKWTEGVKALKSS